MGVNFGLGHARWGSVFVRDTITILREIGGLPSEMAGGGRPISRGHAGVIRG